MNLIIVNDFAYVNGGAGKVALSSALELSKRGHFVTLFSAVGPIEPNLLNQNLQIKCIGQHEILKDPSRLRALIQGIWNFKAKNEFSNLLDSLNPSNTIIHIHSWTKGLSSSIIRTAIKKRFKIVCTLHEYFIACPNGGFYNYPKSEICHLKPMSVNCLLENCDSRSYSQKLWRVIRQYIQKKAGLIPEGIDHFISISDFSLKILEPFLPSHANVYKINNPIDVKMGEPAPVDINSEFIAVGRISKEKGPHFFAEAASIAEVKATWIGDGELRNELANSYPNVKTTGWLSHNGVIEKLRSARALIFPSLWYETQGLVVLEAAALGLPVIVADTSSAREMVIHGETGLWFKGGNLQDLIDKIKILQEPSFAKQMGQKAYSNFWSNPPTADKHIIELEQIYKKILKK